MLIKFSTRAGEHGGMVSKKRKLLRTSRLYFILYKYNISYLPINYKLAYTYDNEYNVHINAFLSVKDTLYYTILLCKYN